MSFDILGLLTFIGNAISSVTLFIMNKMGAIGVSIDEFSSKIISLIFLSMLMLFLAIISKGILKIILIFLIGILIISVSFSLLSVTL